MGDMLLANGLGNSDHAVAYWYANLPCLFCHLKWSKMNIPQYILTYLTLLLPT